MVVVVVVGGGGRKMTAWGLGGVYLCLLPILTVREPVWPSELGW